MENSPKKYSFISSAALLLTAAVWGFSFVVVKDSLDYVGAFWIIAIRFTLGAFLVFLLCFKRLKKITPSVITHGIILGLLFFTAYATQTVGCKYTTAGKNAFLTTLYVVLVPFFSWLFLKVRPRWFLFLAAFMSITGIGLLALNPAEESFLNMNAGDILTLICGLFFALHIIFGAKFVVREDPLLLTGLQFLTAGLLGFVCAPFADPLPEAEILFSWKVVSSLLYLTLFASIYGFSVQNICLKYVPSALASLFLSFESVFGIFFSVLVLGERLTLRMWAGCVLIFCAVIVAEVFPALFKKASPSFTKSS